MVRWMFALRALFGLVRVHDEKRIVAAAGVPRPHGRGGFGVAYVPQRLPRLALGLELRRGREPRTRPPGGRP